MCSDSLAEKCSLQMRIQGKILKRPPLIEGDSWVKRAIRSDPRPKWISSYSSLLYSSQCYMWHVILTDLVQNVYSPSGSLVVARGWRQSQGEIGAAPPYNLVANSLQWRYKKYPLVCKICRSSLLSAIFASSSIWRQPADPRNQS